jgi:hypothetical protein
MRSKLPNLKQIYPDCWQWMRLARRLPGGITEEEANVLFHLARMRATVADAVVVQVDGSDARAALLLGAGLRGKLRPRLIAVGSERSHYSFDRCRLGHIVEAVIRPPELASAAWSEGIDILFASSRDLGLWSRFVKSGGLVVLRDASGIEHLQAPLYSDIHHFGSLVWATKRCSESNSDALDRAVEALQHLKPAIALSIDQQDRIDMAIARQQDYIRRAAREIVESRHAIEALHRSWSWKLTAPLRFLIESLHAVSGVLGSPGTAAVRAAGLMQWLRFRQAVRASGLFDERYYRDRHPDVPWARTSPLLHFFVRGANECANPNELLDLRYYLDRYRDVAASTLNPLVHYLKFGAYEGHDPHPYFDSSFYLDQNPDIREARLNPLGHYLAAGIVEGRDPNPWFDTSEYLEQNPDVATFGLNPLAHYADQ